VKEQGKKAYKISSDKIWLKFKYDVQQIQKIKSIRGWWWNQEVKCWTVPYSDANLELVRVWGFVHIYAVNKIVGKELVRSRLSSRCGGTQSLARVPEGELAPSLKIRIAIQHKNNIEITKGNRHPKLTLSYWKSWESVSGKLNIDPKTGTWFLPNIPLVVSVLTKNNYNIQKVEETKQEDWEVPDWLVEYESKSKFRFTSYQLEGIKFVHLQKGKALIADEMGLGKTIEALGYLATIKEKRPVLILCKASAKINWLRECAEWLPNEFARLLEGRMGEEINPIFSIYICNYDILGKRLNQILEVLKPKIVIVDECQAVKNQDALRTRAFQALCKGTKQEIETQDWKLDRKELEIIPMSGTPIVNRPDEFFTVLNILNPSEFPTWEFYKKRYCFKADGFYDKRLKKERMLELHQEVSKVMIRRLKKDVLSELPDKLRSVIPLEMTNREEYKRAEKEFIQWVRENFGEKSAKAASRAEQLVFINRMKMLAAKGKLQALETWLDDFMESGEKLVLFCNHKFVVEQLEQKYNGKSTKLVGGMKLEDKQASIDKFNESGDTQLFIGNLIAAGDSINLTSASNVAFAEFGWTPGSHVQAEDRCHRMGQKDTVNCYYFIAENTIEEYLMRLISEKMKTLGAVLDGKEVMEEDLLTGIMRIYAGK